MSSEERNNEFLEEYLDNTCLTDSDLAEGAMENIFDSCEINNTGYTCVSTLINFMAPFMQQNLNELDTIKLLLDPFGIDPKIDKVKFCAVMRKWSNEKKVESNSPPVTPSTSNGSTYPDNFRSPLLSTSFEDNYKSSYSCGSTPSPLTHHNLDKSLEFQTEIDNLKRQNRKLNDDLQDLRSQLQSSEECNTHLQAVIVKITKRLEIEQQSNQNLQKLKLECEELRESDTNLKRDVERLVNNNNLLRNEKNQRNRNLEELEDEKIQLSEELERYRAKNNENIRLLSEARNKNNQLKEQLSAKEDNMRDVEDKFNSFQDKIKDLENTITFLRAEKEKATRVTPKLEKNFKENIDTKNHLQENLRRCIAPNTYMDQNSASINKTYESRNSKHLTINLTQSSTQIGVKNTSYKHVDTPIVDFGASLKNKFEFVSPLRIIKLPLQRFLDNYQISPISNNNNQNLAQYGTSTPISLPHSPHITQITHCIDDHTFTINNLNSPSVIEEDSREMATDDTLYSIMLDPKILQNNSLLNELKEVSIEEHDVEHIKCLNKVKYLEGKLDSLEDEYNSNLNVLKSQDMIIKKFESQSNDLEKIIQSLKEDLKNMEYRLKSKSDKIKKYENTITEKDTIIHEIETEMRNLITLNKSLISEKDSMIQEKKSFEKKLENMKQKYEQEIAELQESLEQVEMNMKSLSKDSKNYSDLKIKLENVTKDLNKVIENYEVLKGQNSDRNVYHNSDDEEVIKELKICAVNFEKQIHIFKQKIINLKKDCDEKANIITKLNETIDCKSKEIEELKISMLSVNRTELEQLKKHASDQKEQITSLEIQLRLKESEFDKQSHLCNRHELQIEQLNTNLLEHEHLIEQNEELRKIERRHKMCPRYADQIKTLRSQLYEKDKEMQKLYESNSKIAPFKHQLETLIFENNKLKTEYEKMHTTLTNENFQLQTKAQNESEELEKYREENFYLKSLVHDLQINSTQLRIEIDNLKLEKDNLKKYGIRSLENCGEIEILNTRLQESLGVPSIQNPENTNCGKCLSLQSELETCKLICMKQQETLDKLQIDYNEFNPRPETARLRSEWGKLNQNTKWNRTIKEMKRLENRLETESAKNEELSNELANVLSRVKVEKSQLEIPQNDWEIKYKEEIIKFKSYLEETSNQLIDITRESCIQMKTFDGFSMDIEEESDILPFRKETYNETYYVNFNRNLSHCIYILMNKNKSVKGVSHVSIQVIPDSFSAVKHIQRPHISRSKTIKLQPAKFVPHRHHHHHSAPPTPKLRSKFGVRSQSPETLSGFITQDNEQQNMAEPLSFESPKLANKLHKTLLEMNNNISPDSPTSIVTNNFPTISLNEKSPIINEANSFPSSQPESKVESTTSNDVGVPVVNVADAVHESRPENWSLVNDTVRRFSNMSISASSTNSGSSESLSIDNENTLTDDIRHSLKLALDMEIANKNSELKLNSQTSPPDSEKSTTYGILRGRSKSQSSHDAEPIELFPSIPDTLLENLNLETKSEEESKEDICEQDEIERKFMALSLAFTTDATTLIIRRERIQKFRDQAEQNLLFEVQRLMTGIHKLNPLCIDAERTELVTSLITQADILMQAVRQSWNTSQCFGAVQQEWRLSESVKLMLKYVESIKLQRDTARRQFQYTRRMLQETTSTETPKAQIQPKTATSNSSNSSSNNSNSRLMTRRRASIATISRPAPTTDTLRTLAIRRSSPSHTDLVARRLELPERSPAVIRSTRQSRAELGVGVEQLQNIHENMEAESSDVSDYEGSEISSKSTYRLNNIENFQINDTRTPNPYALMICNFFRRYLGDILHSSGLLHEICVIGALVFFFIAAMQLGSILLELEYTRRGIPINRIPFKWANWDEVLKVLFNWDSSHGNGPRPI